MNILDATANFINKMVIEENPNQKDKRDDFEEVQDVEHYDQWNNASAQEKNLVSENKSNFEAQQHA